MRCVDTRGRPCKKPHLITRAIQGYALKCRTRVHAVLDDSSKLRVSIYVDLLQTRLRNRYVCLCIVSMAQRGITDIRRAPDIMLLVCAGSEILYELLHGLETIEVARSTDAKQKILYSVSTSVKRYSILFHSKWQYGNGLRMRNVTLSSSGFGVRN